MLFQMTFAIITPALIIGTFPERVSFPFLLLFVAGWVLILYVPVAHWVSGQGWLAASGTIDFARRDCRPHDSGRVGAGHGIADRATPGPHRQPVAAAQPRFDDGRIFEIYPLLGGIWHGSRRRAVGQQPRIAHP